MLLYRHGLCQYYYNCFIKKQKPAPQYVKYIISMPCPVIPERFYRESKIKTHNSEAAPDEFIVSPLQGLKFFTTHIPGWRFAYPGLSCLSPPGFQMKMAFLLVQGISKNSIFSYNNLLNPFLKWGIIKMNVSFRGVLHILWVLALGKRSERTYKSY